MDLSVTDLESRAKAHEDEQLTRLVLQVRILEAVSLLSDNNRWKEGADAIAFLHDKLAYFDAADRLLNRMGHGNG